MTNTFNTKNFVRIFCDNTRSWKRKNYNVQTYLMPMQEEKKDEKEKKPLVGGGVGGGGCLVVLI